MAIVMVKSAEAMHTGWFAADYADEIKLPIPANSSNMEEGKKIFAENCAKCHGKSGKGDGWSSASMQVELPDLSDKAALDAESDGALFWKIRTGQFEMPPFQLVLKDEEIWKTVVYLRSLAK